MTTHMTDVSQAFCCASACIQVTDIGTGQYIHLYVLQSIRITGWQGSQQLDARLLALTFTDTV